MVLKEYSLGDLLKYEQPTKYIVSSTNYDDSYQTPVLTAGKSFILGYTDETDGIYEKDDLPVIIFDDFTTSSQYVDFPFKVKSSAMKILTPNKDLVLPKYIYYRMQIIQFDHSTHKRYWIQQYSKIKIRIPELEVQKVIVRKIEELFSQLDSSKKELNTINEQLNVYRRAVFKDAFDSIARENLHSIESVCEKVVDCPHSTPKWVEDGKICLRTTNFRRGYLDMSEKNFVSEETFIERNRRVTPTMGDILFSREGAILGIASIIPENMEACLGQRMMLLRPKKNVNNRFLMHFLNSPAVNKLVVQNIGGTASPHINVSDIKEFLIPIPSMEVQLELVKDIECKISVCDNIQEIVKSTLLQADVMRKSILKDAFEGRL